MILLIERSRLLGFPDRLADRLGAVDGGMGPETLGTVDNGVLVDPD